MFLKELRESFKVLIGDEDKPIAVFSALWPLALASRLPTQKLCEEITTILKDIADGRTLLMPAFAKGFQEGVCDLDNEPSQTGALSEYFRLKPDTQRTVCPFFSFAVTGEKTQELLALRPEDAWGGGSLYEWMYLENVNIVTLGVHPTHCSYTHYAEWLMRDSLIYRYNKEFSGDVIHNGKKFPIARRLFVRSQNPPAINDFTSLLEVYTNNGMKINTIEGVNLSSINAKTKIDIIIDIMKNDPLALVQNKLDFLGKE